MPKTYKLREDIKPLSLSPVTPRALKFYKESGLFSENDIDTEGYLTLLLDEKQVAQWVSVLFNIDEETLSKLMSDFDNFNFDVLMEAHWDFFLKLNPRLNVQNRLQTYLQSLIAEMRT